MFVRAARPLVLLLLAAGQAHALDPARHVSQLQITSWGKKQGLPANDIAALAQTADGYLWIGTAVGIVRFDGRRFTVYTKARYPALPSDDIVSLAAAGETLWIGTSGGLVRLAGDKIFAVPGSPQDFTKSLFVDRNSRLWFSTHTRLYRQEGSVFLPMISPQGKPLRAGQFAQAGDGTIWMTAAPDELWRWRDGRLERADREVRTSRLLGNPDGSVWAAGAGSLVRVGGGTDQSFPIPRDTYLGIARDGAGSIWLTSGHGLTRLTASGAVETMKADAFGGIPIGLLVDREGSLWVGTDARGLFRLRDSSMVPWGPAEGLPSQAVNSFFEDGGGVWITTANGVGRVSGDKVDAPVGDLSRPILGVYAEGGRVWLSTPEGLFLREGGADRKLLENLVPYLAKRDDGMWAATQGGLDQFRDGKLVANFGENVFFSLRFARDGSIWAGNQVGVCRLAEGNLRCFSANEGAPRTQVFFIHEDATGDIWLGTNEDGLYRLHEGRFTRFTTAQGLPSNSHYAVLEDDRGRLWTSSPIGIARFDKASLIAGAARVRLYGERDGMRTADCTGGGATGLRARDGKLWFATGDGAVVVNPSLPDPPSPVLASRIEERSQDERGWVTLRYAAPTLAFGDAVTFRHQLTGFDTEWVAASEPVASYTNVPPGSYRFLAQARVGPGAWGPAAEVLVTVPARWWQTGLFRAAAVAAFLCLVLGVHRLRLASLTRQKRRLEGEVATRTRELGARTHELAQANATLEDRVEQAVASLREAERMAAYGTMVAGVAHEVRQPIFALGTTAYVLQQKLSDRADLAPQLALVTRETKRVNAIMDELLAFARPAALSKTRVSPSAVLREAADSFRVEHDPAETIPVSIEGSTDRAVFLDEARIVQVLVNLMGNATKHAAGVTRIALRAAESDGRLSITVENDGSGISPEHLPHIFEPFYGVGDGKGTGLGLAIVRRLVELHGGDVRVASDAGGTRFTLELPMEC